MDAASYFARDYAGARAKFLEAVDAAGATPRTHAHPLQGPDGGELATDVAVFGDRGADRILLINSATHGVEGFCGSGAIVGWLRSGGWRALPDGVKVVLVHAINPHGFAHCRRVTEDNVDLNRNFVDHRAPHPVNQDYERLHPHVLPVVWDGNSQAAFQQACDAYAGEHGDFALQAALSRGQYSHADGVFFGGIEPTWSNRTFRSILDEHLQGARIVAFQDYHTGLGPFGTADIISGAEPGSALERRLNDWYGHGISSPAMGNSTSPSLHGVIDHAVIEAAPEAEIVDVTMEFGTYPLNQVLEAVRGDNWLYVNGDVSSPEGQAMKAAMKERFYPDQDDWRELVWLRSRQIIARALAGLARA